MFFMNSRLIYVHVFFLNNIHLNLVYAKHSCIELDIYYLFICYLTIHSTASNSGQLL